MNRAEKLPIILIYINKKKFVLTGEYNPGISTLSTSAAELPKNTAEAPAAAAPAPVPQEEQEGRGVSVLRGLKPSPAWRGGGE